MINLADFGLSVVCDTSDILRNSVGTSYFMPPECCKENLNETGFSGKKADIWSLGVALFCFCFKEVPFKGANIFEIFENIEKQEFALIFNFFIKLYIRLEFPNSRKISPELKFLFSKILQKNPEKRISLKFFQKKPFFIYT